MVGAASRRASADSSIDPTKAQPQGKIAEVAKWYLVSPRGADLARIADLVDAHGWRPIIDSAVPFDAFQAAYDKVDGGKAAGKVVITISEPSETEPSA